MYLRCKGNYFLITLQVFPYLSHFFTQLSLNSSTYGMVGLGDRHLTQYWVSVPVP